MFLVMGVLFILSIVAVAVVFVSFVEKKRKEKKRVAERVERIRENFREAVLEETVCNLIKKSGRTLRPKEPRNGLMCM